MAEWIWYPGEFEHKYVCEVNMRKYKRNHVTMPIWKVAPLYPYVKFEKTFILKEDEEFTVFTDGICTLESNGRNRFVRQAGNKYLLKAGEHRLAVSVYADPGKICTVFIDSKTIVTDSTWECSLMDGILRPVDCCGFSQAENTPNAYKLPLVRRDYVKKTQEKEFILYDFGKETFGYLCFQNPNGKGKLKIYYGESEDEARDFDFCELLDELSLENGNDRTQLTKAFRYVAVQKTDGADYDDIHMLYEYRPFEKCAYLKTQDELLQKIWDTSIYTLDLNRREFFLDGIKRDRWVWSGDATQAYLMNWYSFFDEDVARKTQVALAGKEEITQHLNTIVDYTLYWLISFRDHYRYTGDKRFITMWYDRFCQLADYVLSCADEKYRIQKRKKDWVFIDWGKGLTKDSDSYSFLQILLCHAMRGASEVAQIVGDAQNQARFAGIAQSVYQDLQENYYDHELGAFIYSIKDGKPDRVVLRQPNIMAIFYGVATKQQGAAICESVLLNESIPALETPYMRFYELSALCMLGKHSLVYDEIKSYWGGMLNEGATSFWELYRPEEKGPERYAMYNYKYGKSLCHAWGASPLWLIGRYFLGLEPAEDGYRKFKMKPCLEVFKDLEVKFYTAQGAVTVNYNKKRISIFAENCEGTVEIGDKSYCVAKNAILDLKL